MQEKTLEILLVEPARDLGALVRVALSDYKVRISSVSSAVEAKSKLIQGIPDLVICDMMLGENKTGGALLCVELGSHPNFAALPLLLAADEVTEQILATASSAGAAGVVSKPLDEQELKQRVQEILGLTSSVPAAAHSTDDEEEDSSPISFDIDIDGPTPAPSAPRIEEAASSKRPERPPPSSSTKEERLKAAQLILAKALNNLRTGSLLDVIELEEVPRVVLEVTSAVCRKEEETAKEAPSKSDDVNVDLSTVFNK